jgi:hypothetical protein
MPHIAYRLALASLFTLSLGCSGGGGARRGGDTGGAGGEDQEGGKGGATGGSGGRAGTGGRGGASGAGGNGGEAGSGGSSGGSGGSGGVSGAGGSGGGGGTAGSGGSGGAGGGGAGGSGGTGGTGGSGPAPTGHLFGAHSGKYPAGTIKPTGSQDVLDAAVKAAYDKWKAAYVTAGCGGYYIKTTGGEAGSISSSPAIGSGMIVAAMMAGHDPEAQKIFDGLLAVARKFPSYLAGHQDLVTYTLLDGCKRKSDGDSTVDGDLDFGFALVLADKQWGSGGTVKYLDEAKKTIAAIKKYDMNPTLKIPLIGDWASLPGEDAKGWFTDTKPPHFMLGHFRGFAQASGDAFWMQTVDALQALTTKVQTQFSPMTGLLPQYLDESVPAKVNYLKDPNAGYYFSDCGWIPFRFAADYIASGDARSKTALGKMVDWVKMTTGGDPAKIVDGYKLDGAAIGTKGTVEFIAPFAAGAIFDAANQTWLDAAWKLMTANPGGSQTADTANLLGMLVASGNWWTP